MSASRQDHPEPPPTDALSRRLAALRDRPVNLERLEAVMDRLVPAPEPVRLIHPAVLWRRRVVSVAATLVVLLSILAASWFAFAPRPALAAPQLLADIHNQALEMRHIQVSSFDDARRELAKEWRAGPTVPNLDGVVPMECCMHKLGSKVLQCVSLDLGGEKIVMVVGRDKDIAAPGGKVVDLNGQRVILTSNGGVQMAMTEQDGRWICLMGRIDSDRLVELIGSIR